MEHVGNLWGWGMSDEQRLVDIGIRRQLIADIHELRPHDDWEVDQDRLLNDDVPWLLSRVRALEAQAAAVDATGLAVASEVATRAINLYEGAVRSLIFLLPSDHKARGHENRLDAELGEMRGAIAALDGDVLGDGKVTVGSDGATMMHYRYTGDAKEA